MDREQLKQLVETAFSSSRWDLYTERFVDYLLLLFEYNQHYNIFSRKLSAEDVVTSHIYDSLLGEPFVQSGVTVADVGTGAGFPGLCWALAREDLKLTLIEKSVRKAQFLTHAIERLQLSQRVTVLNSNVTDCSFDNIDVVTSRAMCSVSKLIDLISLKNLKNKKLIMFKALMENIEKEIKDLPKNIEISIHPLVPLSKEKTRNLVILKF